MAARIFSIMSARTAPSVESKTESVYNITGIISGKAGCLNCVSLASLAGRRSGFADTDEAVAHDLDGGARVTGAQHMAQNHQTGAGCVLELAGQLDEEFYRLPLRDA